MALVRSKKIENFKQLLSAKAPSISLLRGLKKNKNYSHINRKNSSGATRLMVAATKGNYRKVSRLINRLKAKLDIQDKKGMTALMRAVQKGHTMIVEALYDAKANISLVSKSGKTAKQLAEENNRPDIVNILNGGWEDEFYPSPRTVVIIPQSSDAMILSALQIPTRLTILQVLHNKPIIKSGSTPSFLSESSSPKHSAKLLRTNSEYKIEQGEGSDLFTPTQYVPLETKKHTPSIGQR
jgi:hypothetical protein